jgi:hypothetical protein
MDITKDAPGRFREVGKDIGSASMSNGDSEEEPQLTAWPGRIEWGELATL